MDLQWVAVVGSVGAVVQCRQDGAKWETGLWVDLDDFMDWIAEVLRLLLNRS